MILIMYLYKIILLLLILIITKKFLVIETFKQEDVTYIFWTGGYDSTFRLCQAVIDENRIVQPIYISAIIDNLEKNKTRRKSIVNEEKAMNIIIQKINSKYPNLKNNIKPLMNIKKIDIDDDINKAIKNLHKKKRMRRAVCQYNALAQVTRNLNKDIEMSVEYAPHDSMMFRNIFDSLVCKNNKCILKDNLDEKNKDLYIFNRCTFPTIKYSKKKMLQIAKKNGYDDILHLTWSCWYPIQGNPCGRCIMCRERII